MSTQRVEECEGILIDSGNGDIQGNYDHNENYIFNICIDEASQIRLIFTSFCTEVDFDVLKIYDGKDTLAPMIGNPYSGTQSPGIIFSSGSCLTLHFKSDENITCTGWRAQWSVEIEEPIPSPIEVSPHNPSCSTKVLNIDFERKIPCSNLNPGNFSINGPVAIQVDQANPINCQGDSTFQAQVILNEGLFKSGDYYLSFLSPHIDACGQQWELYSTDTLEVRDCPIEIELSVDRDSICIGECSLISIEVGGGDLRTYHYDWREGFPDSEGPMYVCPSQSQTYHVRVYDENGSPVAEDSIHIFLRPNPQIPEDSIVCETTPPFNLLASPTGGNWSGDGILDTNTGFFHPDSAGDGLHTIGYEDIYGCTSRMQIRVNGIDAGRDEAACTGAPPFGLIDYEPLGGRWSGTHVSDSGIFQPIEAGIFTLTYSVNGCTDEKEVIVGAIDLTSATPKDTVCESDPDITLNFYPKGGVWKGVGIVDTLLGIFSPQVARGGSHKLVYQLQGCKDSIYIHVRNIAIGGFLSVCTDSDSVWLGDVDPDGGIWSGGGIIDANLGLFDPGYRGIRDYNQVLRYTVNGCYAERTVLVRETRVALDTAWFCMNDGRVPLDFDNTRRSPYNGSWSGEGVLVPDNPGIFVPSIVGPGGHTLIYEANGCVDSLVAMVYDNPIATDTALCEFSDPIQLRTDRPGGVWKGMGIIDTLQGIFDPRIAGRGFYQIFYASPQGCYDSVELEVYVPETPVILNLADTYCFQDTNIELSATRRGGMFSGPGIQGNFFNPALAGPGEHIIKYELGSGSCLLRANSITRIREPLEVSAFASTDTICSGGYIGIYAEGVGGRENFYTYSWLDSVGIGDSLVLRPFFSSTYQVVLSDGCSIEDTAEVFVAIKDGFNISYIHGDTVCEGNMGFVVAKMNPPGNYEVRWEVEPTQISDTLRAPSLFEYELEVEDLNSGCIRRGITDIPSYEHVYAAFSPNPNAECVTLLAPDITFLNQSSGASQGIWEFGDGNMADFVPNENPMHSYVNIGEYEVNLYIENEAGCWDTTSQIVCVLPEKPRIYIPNSFSPNGDNINDLFEIQGVSVLEYDLRIFDRWGKEVFTSKDIHLSWDGTYRASPAPAGIYTYYLNLIYKSDNPLINYGPIPWWEQGTLHLLR
ncbi:MAG: gliding motility-associated C-terminal domain-containing protein [Bacteroidota bacterium]